MHRLSQLIILCSGWRSRPLASVLAILAFTLGLFLAGLSVQFWVDIRVYLEHQTGASARPSQLVLSKDISPLLALRPEAAAFSPTELATISLTPFIHHVEPIIANQFRAELFFQLGEAHYGTELFFEAVPPSFLVSPPPSWDWTAPKNIESAQSVPILIPREFLTLYNLGFAPARNLPIMQESMLQLIPLHLRIQGQSGNVELPARIVGTTDQIASLLVPISFMTWANSGYSNIAPSTGSIGHQPRRIIVDVNDPSSAKVAAFLRTHGYRADNNSSALRDAALLLSSVLGVIGLVALLILGLSALVYSLNLRLFLHENGADLRLLVLWGYHPRRIAFASVLGIAFPLTILGIIILGLLAICTDLTHAYLAQSLFLFPSGLSSLAILSTLIFILILPGIQYVLIRKHLALPRSINQNSNILKR